MVEPFTGDDLSLGGPALGEKFLPVSQLTANMDAALLEERTPLVFKDMELVPSTSYHFAKSAQPVVYVEVYDPALKELRSPRAWGCCSTLSTGRPTSRSILPTRF